MLSKLPAEIALHAISFLPLNSLRSISLVSREWNSLIAINETTVYRNTAIIHRFIREDQLSAGSTPNDWKAYCKRWVDIERGWRGKATPIIRELTSTGTRVHRIKIDRELGLAITTSQEGGLLVCDIKNNRVLWALSTIHVVSHAHCEYGRGYIVFNRNDNSKEVWKHTLDVDNFQHSEASPPDQDMLEESRRAASIFCEPDRLRGRFKAWALLHMPEMTRAFRFSYPTLLAAAANNAYLWDVPRSQLILVIRDIQRQNDGQQLGSINYVEVNDLFVFICGSRGLRIFGREGGALLYQLSTMELSSAAWDIQNGSTASIVHPQRLVSNTYSNSPVIGEFMACHVSPSGNDLAVLTTHGRLVILPGFQRLFTRSSWHVHHREIAIILNFQPFSSDGEISYYLAVADEEKYGNFKLAVGTSKGIYLISPDFDFDPLTADCPPEPGVTVSRLSSFDHNRSLPFISCLQITQDAIYFTCRPSRAHAGLPMIMFGAEAEAEDEHVEWEDGHAEWEDESDSEEEIIQPMDVGFDLLRISSNTVYGVSF